MNTPTISILTSSSVLKITALLFGYAFWLVLAQNQFLKINQKIPLSFYTPEDQFNITAPSEVTVELLGKRSDLQKIDLNALGIQIDISHLKQTGVYPIKINANHIFLPNYVKLLYYTPAMINLELSERN